MLTYTCYENIDYKDSETGRPISNEELNMKASMSPMEYLKHISNEVEWWEENGPNEEKPKPEKVKEI